MALVFVSYRAFGDRHAARLVTDRLRTRFGQKNVFLDNTPSSPGTEFPPNTMRELREARAVLVVIGPRWLAEPNVNGRNVTDPDDWVHREIDEAIRTKKLVIPVLVNCATAPHREQLPPNLRPLTERQFLSIGNRTLNDDIQLLTQRMKSKVPELSVHYGKPRADYRISVPEGLGILIGITTVLLTYVNSDLWTKTLVAGIGAVAALVLGLTTCLITDRQQRSRPRTVRITTEAVVFSALVAGAMALPAYERPPEAQPPFMSKQEYALRPSSSITTNDQDKMDADTGCPGWGNMNPRIGPSRCGENADVIVDERGMRTADGGPHLYRLVTGMDPSLESCVTTLNIVPDPGLPQIDVADLAANDLICIRTDQENIALVRVDGVTKDRFGQLLKLTVSLMVWKP
jgi:hypothetical protein